MTLAGAFLHFINLAPFEQARYLLRNTFASAEEEDEAAAKALEEGGGNQALDDAAEAGEEEEDEAEPAAQHGWEGEQPQQEALPEAGPKGLASQAAAAQVCTMYSFRPYMVTSTS